MNPRSNQFLETKRRRDEFYNSIHEVMVTDVQLERGMVTVAFNTGGPPLEAPIPLTGFSRPPSETDEDDNFKRAAWGVYIPQKGDVLNLGFDVRGGPIILGYKAFGWRFMAEWDAASDDKGGINWGVTSKVFKSGDWGWRSSRGAQFYLGDRVSLSSGINRLTMSSVTRDATLSSDLLIIQYGSCSEERKGSARRLLLGGMDTTETPIIDPTTATPAQESTDYVRVLSLPVVDPKGRLLVRTSTGQVVNDVLKQVTPPFAFDPTLTSLVGNSVRVLREVKDPIAGVSNVWSEYVDDLGNYGSSSLTATGFQWNTPLASWNIVNVSTKWTSVGSYDIVGLAITLTGASVKIGSSAAVSPLVKGDLLMSALSPFLQSQATVFSALATAVAPTPVAALAPLFADLSVSALAALAALSGVLSLKNFTD